MSKPAPTRISENERDCAYAKQEKEEGLCRGLAMRTSVSACTYSTEGAEHVGQQTRRERYIDPYAEEDAHLAGTDRNPTPLFQHHLE